MPSVVVNAPCANLTPMSSGFLKLFSQPVLDKQRLSRQCPVMQLDTFLKRRRMTDSAFAAQIGCNRSQISRIRRGLAWVSAPLAWRILEASGGKVTPNDLFEALQSAAADREPPQ